MRIPAVAALLIAAASASAAPRWRVQFFHDEDQSRLQINDLRFCSAERGIAVGVLAKQRGEEGVAVVTRNGGRDWQMVELREPGRTLFCLDDTHIWMIGTSGLWFSDEGGLSWRKIHSEDGLLDVYFASPQRGWIVGVPKLAMETSDGGKSWRRVAAAAEPKTTPRRTAYSEIAFATAKRGMILGRSVPPRQRTDSDLPIWMDDPELRRQEPRLMITMETSDGGESWRHLTVSMFGYISRVQLGTDGRGLGLIQFDGTFPWPAEVHRLNLHTGASERAFAEKGFAITDIALVPGGAGYAAGYEAPGLTAWSPLPGRVRVLQSSDLRQWRELEVDYRAVAKRAVFAQTADGKLWLACDTGMILRLEEHP
jgi:photosystem II stability/assembly factor-like uncharacterized protein